MGPWIHAPFVSSSMPNSRAPPVVLWALALIVLTAIQVQHGQGAQSTCTYNEAHTAANCSNRNLDYVPWRLHKNILKLDLSSNNFSILDNKSFIDYNFITNLCLRNNSMHQIKANAFLSLNYLRILDLSNNKLTHIPTDAIKVVAYSLEQLILAGNKLFYIQANAFSQLSKLQLLDLSGNSIYRLDDKGVFAGLTSLTVFKIRHNAIKHLPSDSFDDFPKESMKQVQLYDNRWMCDCDLRWLWKWINATSPSVWDSPGYPIRCDGPSLVGDQSLDSLPLEKLACPVRMKTSGATRELDKGGNTTLLCKYTIVPKAEAIWMKNEDALEVGGNKKYSVALEESRDRRGDTIYVSELRINDFKREDIARYKCLIQNIRGEKYIEYKLTLKGVDFDSVVFDSRVSHKADDSAGVDKMSIIIAVAVVGGIILIIVIGVLIFCSVNRVQRKKQAKRDAIVEHVKEHFIKNSDVIGSGDTSTLDKSKSAFITPGLSEDGTGNGSPGMENHNHPHLHLHHHPHHPNHHGDDNRSNHTNDSTYKPPLDPDESEPMLIMSQGGGHHSPGSPGINNGNTYVSFGSEFTDPGEFPTHVPVYTNPHRQTPTLGGGGGNHYDLPDGPAVNGNRYGVMVGSQEGSATPLLDRFTPVFLDDSDEPVEDYASYPVYDSVTNSLQHPRHTQTPPNTSAAYNNNMNHADGGRMYGTLPSHLHSQHQQTNPRGGNVSSNYNHNRSLGSQSSFQYPAGPPSTSGCGSMPRTPGSVRSVAAVPPWSVNSNNPNPPPPPPPSSYSGPGNGSPPIIENHYHPPPLVHRPHPEYRDYREMRYPVTSPNPGAVPPLTTTATPPCNRDVAQTRNLGYSPVPSSSSGPKKPPRVYIPGSSAASNGSGGSGSSSSSSRDCIEMSLAPSGPQPHDSTSIDYITSSEAQQYSKNYGITPGTPV